MLHSPTGSGKTLAFLLPVVSQLNPALGEPQALVLCPSRELAYQTHRVAQSLLASSGLRAIAVAGGANPSRQAERAKKEKPQLIVATASRLADLALDNAKIRLRRIRPVSYTHLTLPTKA